MNTKIIFRNIFIIVMIIVTLLIISEFSLKSSILHSETKFQIKQLNKLLDKIDHNNDILSSKKVISNQEYLEYLGANTDQKPEQIIYIAKKHSIPVAVIITSTAPDGYSGNINLMIAIKLKTNEQNSNTIYNTTVLHHNETPGLGDKIESSKSNWLKQFINKPISSTDKWQVKDDVDSITGATITSEAVTRAIKKALLLINQHPEIITDE